MNNGINQKLKITGIGFDWRDIGRDDYGESKKRLDRDGLNTDTNDFLMVYLGGGNRREKAGEQPKFIAWHIYFFTRLRIVYDLFLIVFLPLVLIKEKYKPDVFYATEFPFLLSQIIPVKILKSKIYFRVLNLPRELALTKGKKGKLFYLYYKIIEKITVPFVDKFIAINETTKKYLLDLGVKEEKIVMDIPDTIMADAAFIEKVNKYFIREKYNIKDKKIILSVGSLIKEKGYEELLMAFAGLNRNDMMLVVCGEGKEKSDLLRLSGELRISNKVIFAGHVRREEIWNYFFSADVFALFTKSESLGMVFWEAMHAGLPVIGAAVGGVEETIGGDGERGFYWTGDLKDFEEKINLCLNNEETKEAMIRRAKEYVEKKLLIKTDINKIYNQS